MDGDVANFYASLVTVKKDINSEEMVLGQGLPSSPIVAFICYKSLFDFIYKHAKESGIDFTLYVDDMAFSSDKEIPQSFINKILGILKSKQYDNKLVINNDKIKLYKKECIKKITGVYIKNGLPKISNRKHHEIFLLYKFLIKQMSEGIGDLDEHFLFLNYFVKFSGNLMHLFQVEYGNNFKIENISNHAHKMMLMFYRDVSKILRISFEKIKAGEPYSEDNIKPEYFKILREQFKLLDKNIDHLYEKYKFCSCSTSKPIAT